jgi:predicted nucleic acid-binding protein
VLEGCEGLERLVVDASVAVKWFVPEKDSDKALRLKDS